MNIAHVYSNLIILLCLHTLRESHGLGLHLAVRVKLGYRFYTLVSWHDDWKTAIGIILKLLYSHTTTEATTLRQLTCMVEEVAVPLKVGHATVVGKRVGITQRHNLAGILPGAQRRWCRAVRYMLRHATCCVEQLIYAVALGEPWALYIRVFILFTLLAFLHHRTAESFLGHWQLAHFALVRYHVAVQLQVVHLWISPHQPSLSVVINHHCGVDMIPRTVLEQRLS